MARFVYTPEMIEFIRIGYQAMGLRELADKFNAEFGTSKTWEQLRGATRNHGITCGRKTGEILKGQTKILTREQGSWLRKKYEDTPLSELTSELNKEFGLTLQESQIRAFLKNHKITCGRTGRFEKGQESWNKGKKGYMGANSTSFKKGQVPHNTKYLGHERITKDGYIEIQVPVQNKHTGYANSYVLKHRWVWEQANGPVPDGHIISFKNGDRTDCRLDNLELITRAEGAIRNKMHYSDLDDDVKQSAALLAKVYAKRHELIKTAKT